MPDGRIDVHHHILPDQYVEAVGADKVGRQGSSGRVPAWSAEDALQKMDAAGVRAAITSISAPGLPIEDAAERMRLARWCNDFAAELCVRHPGRFGMFATLPLPDVRASLDAVSHAYEQCKADGVCLLSNYDGRYLDAVELRPLFEALNERQAVVFLHPTSPQSMSLVCGMSASTLEFVFDTTRAIASIVFGGILRDFPKIRFIFSHAGGAMPYLAQRTQLLLRNNPRLQAFIPNGMSAELAKSYFDTALSAYPETVATLLATVPAHNVLFGTDYPFGPKDQIIDAAASLDRLPLSDVQRAAVARDNAARLFPRFAVA
jgi:6-methylsalicylate decarboxylase